jgi:SAM-dependent methyltransferase
MIHQAGESPGQNDLTEPVPPASAPGGISVTTDDEGISVQARSMLDLDWVLDRLLQRDGRRGGGLLDLGSGMGALASHIGARLGLEELIGVDLDPERLKGAAARGVRPLLLDLNEDPLPLPAGSVRVATCFGLLAYLNLYDNVLGESARVLEDGGWLLLSMPNLASYFNRFSLLFGYQPHAVAVSRYRQAGMIGHHRSEKTSSNMPPLLHGATLRCMREVLDDYGFDVEIVRGFAPGDRRRRIVDGIACRIPGLSRRFLILARKRPSASA